MKQCLKLCMIVILAVSLHTIAAETASVSCTPATTQAAASCFLPQDTATVTQQSIRNSFLSVVTLCMEHADSIQISSEKSFLPRPDLSGTQLHAYPPECSRRLSHLSPYPVPDMSYYIFGLRKIII